MEVLCLFQAVLLLLLLYKMLHIMYYIVQFDKGWQWVELKPDPVLNPLRRGGCRPA